MENVLIFGGTGSMYMMGRITLVSAFFLLDLNGMSAGLSLCQTLDVLIAWSDMSLIC